MKQVTIQTDTITLGQLLKKLDILATGGQAKHFLSENRVLVNGVEEVRRGRKLYPQDRVEIEGYGKVSLVHRD
ncbi:S4 domain-containing protein YaaA [Kroppenstedtia eburnea]|uniref:Ribosome-associated protein n=1 Tax=Kroppenstedtia eburnea TaxID=714067 RepID=A0A1N7JH25_9BACL|nr:S4 domain-containing protein YaaA [Kroppenstedtia eburnea]EGK10169.1 S4 domain protein YaaA [Desmospora sp. 8437]QKI80536.1 S4 domain-containing protein YaaA [Kroppenstedtia eburnea]SIS48692.1 ribosome-associated protein [Kroppenstedtia eburnea]